MQDDHKSAKSERDGIGATVRTTVYLDDFAELAEFGRPQVADDTAWQDGATRDPAFLLKHL